MRKKVLFLICLLFLCLSLTFLNAEINASVIDNDNLELGNPSGATEDITHSTNYLIVRPQYDLSYNDTNHEPNWASWHVNSSDLGPSDRQDDFRPDTTLPATWYEVAPKDYKNSGFDKGHLCPSADRTTTVEVNSTTFLMSNMIPQAPHNNEITWSKLEDYCRKLVSAGNELYIIAGGHGSGGTGSKGYSTSIGNHIVVPAKTWKIIVVLPNGNDDLHRITPTTRVIAVIMPNDQTCSQKKWWDYRVSINEIQTLTGYNFLSALPVDIQNKIESKVDDGPTK